MDSQRVASKRVNALMNSESLKRQLELGNPTETDSRPSALLSANKTSCFEPNSMDITIEGPSLSDLFNFDDFHDEYAAWLRMSDEGTSHADSSYFSLRSVGSMDDVIGKGKGKDAVRD